MAERLPSYTTGNAPARQPLAEGVLSWGSWTLRELRFQVADTPPRGRMPAYCRSTPRRACDLR